jgi:hypothetical protein
MRGCTAAEKAKILAESKARVSKVGKVGDYMVYDVFYSSGPTHTINAKAILVETGPDQFREIFYIDSYIGGAGLMTRGTEIVGEKQPNQMLLTTSLQGMRSLEFNEEFWIGAGASLRLDLTEVNKAFEYELKSAGVDSDELGICECAYQEGWPDELLLRSSLHAKNGDERGMIDVTFRIDHGRAIVTASSFKPPRYP